MERTSRQEMASMINLFFYLFEDDLTYLQINEGKNFLRPRSTSSKLSSPMTSCCCKGGPFSESLERREGFDRANFESQFASKIPRGPLCPLFSDPTINIFFVLFSAFNLPSVSLYRGQQPNTLVKCFVI